MSDLFTALTGTEAASRALHERGALRISGGDRLRFINGMVTNEVSDLASGETRYALLLNRQGRLLTDLFVLACDDALLLDVAAGRAELTSEVLEKHIVADDVEVEDWSADWGQLALEGPGVRARCAAQGIPEPATGHFEAFARNGATLYCVVGGSLTEDGMRLLGPREALEEVGRVLALPPLATEHAEVLRIEALLPAFGSDLSERTLPLEARLEPAISFSKGCYIGQEVVARLDSRNAVKRLLVQIRSEAELASGGEIQIEGRVVGEVTSVANSSVGGPVALGYVRAEFAVPGTGVTVDGVKGMISGPGRG